MLPQPLTALWLLLGLLAAAQGTGVQRLTALPLSRSLALALQRPGLELAVQDTGRNETLGRVRPAAGLRTAAAGACRRRLQGAPAQAAQHPASLRALPPAVGQPLWPWARRPSCCKCWWTLAAGGRRDATPRPPCVQPMRRLPRAACHALNSLLSCPPRAQPAARAGARLRCQLQQGHLSRVRLRAGSLADSRAAGLRRLCLCRLRVQGRAVRPHRRIRWVYMSAGVAQTRGGRAAAAERAACALHARLSAPAHTCRRGRQRRWFHGAGRHPAGGPGGGRQLWRGRAAGGAAAGAGEQAQHRAVDRQAPPPHPPHGTGVASAAMFPCLEVDPTHPTPHPHPHPNERRAWTASWA